MTGSRSDAMHVAHTTAGWIVFDNSTAHRGRLSAPCPTRAEAVARKKALGPALRHQRHEETRDA